MSQLTDESGLKEAVKAYLSENPEVLKAAIRELLQESAPAQETLEMRKARMRALIQEDFDEFPETFKALA